MPSCAITIPQKSSLLLAIAVTMDGEAPTYVAVSAVTARPPAVLAYTDRRKLVIRSPASARGAYVTGAESNCAMSISLSAGGRDVDQSYQSRGTLSPPALRRLG